ncbi:MAG: LPP20 family lipoprotein [Bacteroidales bacterium]|nr:LPP20 family lipoprotein [Bacteroidales bacterium]
MNRVLIYLNALFLITAGCAIKKVPQNQQIPSWIQSRPNLPEYYVGIGSANKNKPDYMQTAKQNALADLATDISVVISSQSVINTIQMQNNFTEDFSSTIKAEVQKELEGYEMVESWEDQNTYWVFYRLNKTTYKTIIEEKKKTAATRALDYFDKAVKAQEINDSKTTLVMLVKALETIKPYSAEDISVNYNNQSIFLGNEIISRLFNTINSLTISGPKELQVKLGQPIASNLLTYQVKSQNGFPQKSIPLKVNYFDRTNTKYLITNNLGETSFGIESVRTKKKSEIIRVEFDFESILKEATRDLTIALALSRTKTPYTETYLTIVRPKFYISSDESNLTQILEDKPLAEALKKKLLESGFPITDKPEESDYKVYIVARTQKTGQTQQYVQVSLNLKLTVADNEGNVIFNFNNDRINAQHFDEFKAGMQAYAEVIKRFDTSVFESLIGQIIFKKP